MATLRKELDQEYEAEIGLDAKSSTRISQADRF
jgi:hypothetical protein